MTEALKYDDIVEEISIESLSDLRERIVYNKKFKGAYIEDIVNQIALN